MRKSIKKYSAKRQFNIHPLAFEAFNFYANLENQFLETHKPDSILSGLNQHHILRFTTSENMAYIFSGFSNRFFDLNNIDETSLLIEYQEISDAETAEIAWFDVMTNVLSSKLEVNCRVDIYQAINQYLPNTPALQSLFPKTHKLSLEQFAMIANVNRLTLQRNISRRDKIEPHFSRL